MDGMKIEKRLIMSMDCALADVIDAARSMAVSEQDLSQGTEAQHVNATDSLVSFGVSYSTIQTPLATFSRGNIIPRQQRHDADV
jgi:hypothetical protein